MNRWQDFFKIVRHPSPDVYYIHWKSSNRHIGDYHMYKEHAEAWIQTHWQSILDEQFEEIVLEPK